MQATTVGRHARPPASLTGAPTPGLGTRVATALVYGGVVLAALAGPPPLFVALAVALFVLGARELRWLLSRDRWREELIGGTLYIAIGLGALVALRLVGVGPVLVALVPTWAADVVAYFVGSAIGSTRIAPRVSPGKTLEGTIAGGLAAAAVAFVVCVAAGVAPLATFVISLAIGPAALFGDLLESAAKRAAGVKDSGDLFPGHGGVLDRIDSLLLVAPVVAVIIALLR